MTKVPGFHHINIKSFQFELLHYAAANTAFITGSEAPPSLPVGESITGVAWAPVGSSAVCELGSRSPSHYAAAGTTPDYTTTTTTSWAKFAQALPSCSGSLLVLQDAKDEL